MGAGTEEEMLQQSLRRLQQLEAASSAAAAAAQSSDQAAFLAVKAAKAEPGACCTGLLCKAPAACCALHTTLLPQPGPIPPCPPSAADSITGWQQLRQLGAGFWLREPRALAGIAERLAKQQFAARRTADDCALLYCALGKRSVLQVGA